MPAKSKMREMEQEFGQPIDELLIYLFDELGSQRAVAEELGVSQSTVSIWLLKLGLEQTTVLKPVSQSQRGA